MKRLAYFIPAMAWAGLIFFLSSRHSLPSLYPFEGFDKIVHASFYGVLAGLLLFGARGPWGRRAFAWAAVASAYGVTDELHQSFVAGRSCDVFDWLADTVGALVCVMLWLKLGAKVAEKLRRGIAPPESPR